MREGYVALLALSFAFGLAVLGGALAVGVQNYLKTVGIEQRRVLDRISLESAAAQVLGEIASGQAQPLRPTRLPDVDINGRRISVITSLPEGKHEPAMDDRREIGKILRRAGLASPRDYGAGDDSLAAFLASRGATAAQEDCLRRDLTYGRAPEAFRPEAAAPEAQADGQAATALPAPTWTAGSGDQIDIRLALSSPQGERILWLRARFGGEGRPWGLHDYRTLTVRRAACGVWP